MFWGAREERREGERDGGREEDEGWMEGWRGGVWWISQYIGLNKALGSSDESMSADFSLFLSRTRSWSLRLSLSLSLPCLLLPL